jgi:hypothetical protein
LEKRLQDRYATLVRQHLHGGHPVATAPRAPLAKASAKAAAQAAWRFSKNRRVTPSKLAAPLHQFARAAYVGPTRPYALAVHDWSFPTYPSPPSKRDQTPLGRTSHRGYELAAVLLVNTAAGDPVVPLELRLRAEGAGSSSRDPAPDADTARLDLVRASMDAAAGRRLRCRLVHVLDAEADSVWHLRDGHRAGHKFLVRVDGQRRVRWRGLSRRRPEVVAALRRRHAFRWERGVDYRGPKARQSVAVTTVVLDRPAPRHRVRGGRNDRTRIPGEALRLRLVVSQVHDADGNLLAEWLLLTNVRGVSAAELALWYYWRWRIESFFKLVQSAGLQLESWLPRTAAALHKRLLLAAMACAVAWAAARRPGEEGRQLRSLLVRLSGRQVKAESGWTGPGLLAGAGMLVRLWEVLEQPGLLRQVADLKDPFWHNRPPGQTTPPDV